VSITIRTGLSGRSDLDFSRDRALVLYVHEQHAVRPREETYIQPIVPKYAVNQMQLLCLISPTPGEAAMNRYRDEHPKTNDRVSSLPSAPEDG
jgi:hypothetical protein